MRKDGIYKNYPLSSNAVVNFFLYFLINALHTEYKTPPFSINRS